MCNDTNYPYIIFCDFYKNAGNLQVIQIFKALIFRHFVHTFQKDAIWVLVAQFYSIGRIIDSIKSISSSVSLYLAYSFSSVHDSLKSCIGTNEYTPRAAF